MAAPKGEDRVVTFRIPADLLDGLQQLFERDGISQSESIRRAVRMFLDAKGVTLGVAQRKRSEGRRGKQ
jgi:metal-responsive CopG/Arc/MetJ family transcriptional regulator